MVTTKLGSSDKRPGTAAVPRDCRFYAGEMGMSTFVLTAAFYGVFSVDKWSFSIFLTLQGAATPSHASLPDSACLKLQLCMTMAACPAGSRCHRTEPLLAWQDLYFWHLHSTWWTAAGF